MITEDEGVNSLVLGLIVLAGIDRDMVSVYLIPSRPYILPTSTCHKSWYIFHVIMLEWLEIV